MRNHLIVSGVVALIACSAGFAWSGGILEVESTGAYYRKNVNLAGSQGVRLQYPYNGLPVGGHTYAGVAIGDRYIELGYSNARGDTAQAHFRQHAFTLNYARSELWIRQEGSDSQVDAQRSSFQPGRGGYIDLPVAVKEQMRLHPGDRVEQMVSGSNPLTSRFEVLHTDGTRTIASWILYFEGLPETPSSGALGASYRVILSTAKNPSDSLDSAETEARASELGERLRNVQVDVVNAPSI